MIEGGIGVHLDLGRLGAWVGEGEPEEVGRSLPRATN